MTDPDRLTVVKAGDLDVGNLYDRISVIGSAGQLLGFRPGGHAAERVLLLGPLDPAPRRVYVDMDADVTVLDIDTIRKPVSHWGIDA